VKGVDDPPQLHASRRGIRDDGEGFGARRDLIYGKQVEVRHTKRDQYGRVLGIVWVKGEGEKGTCEAGGKFDTLYTH